jgi:hypothetical protein
MSGAGHASNGADDPSVVGAEDGAVEAIGWATVELDRAERELAPLLVAGAGFVAAPHSAHLGAACRVGRLAPHAATLAGIPWRGARFVVLLEPTTEGRLAVTLARHGESWCATWARHDPDARRSTAGTVSPLRAGPLGPERLVLGGPIAGPHRLLVEAATIEP